MMRDHPYAALEALEVDARVARRHIARHKLGAGRELEVEQDAAVRDRNYRGGAVFEFWYRYKAKGLQPQALTRVEAQDLLDGFEPEPPPPTSFPKALVSIDHPVKYRQPDAILVAKSREGRGLRPDLGGKGEAVAQGFAHLLSIREDPAWWDIGARWQGEGFLVSFNRRVRRREQTT